MTLGKQFFFLKRKNSLPSAAEVALGKEAVKVDVGFLFCRVLTWHSAKALPSARYVALSKETFADCSLPSAALDKAFAECNRGFAECPKHSAKSLSAVVILVLVCCLFFYNCVVIIITKTTIYHGHGHILIVDNFFLPVWAQTRCKNSGLIGHPSS